MNTLPYRPNVCLLIFNKDNLVFIGERYNSPNIWQFPQGGAEPELSLEENALKEAHEELGADAKLFKIRKKLQATHQYDFEVVPNYAKGIWRGQSQTFWIIDFMGEDKDINLNLYQPEFMNYKWVALATVGQYVEAKRLPGYQKAISEILS